MEALLIFLSVILFLIIGAFFGGRIYQGKKNLKQHLEQIEHQRKALEVIEKQHYETLSKISEELKLKQKALIAIEHKIDGYGNQYLIPNIQLIDELAEQYDYNNSGKRLKECRLQMRQMLKTGWAITGNNPTHANLLLDFFNTKAEDLLTRVKQENYGILKQELADVYALTQYYAKKIMLEAEISFSYYEVRQNELKWASIVHAFKQAEREELKIARELERENERAQREYEKAIANAEAEENRIKEEMAKTRLAVASATAAQKAKYEAQLATLTQRLKDAEEKNQRALSMAQQTKAGYVYMISNIGSFGNNVMKIGMTRRLEPMDRIDELSSASVPFVFDVHAMIYSEDAPALERKLHQVFDEQRVNKVNFRKEFFRITPFEAHEKLKELGIHAQFKMQATAEQYRETLLLEQQR